MGGHLDRECEPGRRRPQRVRLQSGRRSAGAVSNGESSGPGRRYALWFQGCPLRCPGCCNPEMLPFVGGPPRSVAEVLAEIAEARDVDRIEGITLLGGEPLAHAAGAAALARGARALGLSV